MQEQTKPQSVLVVTTYRVHPDDAEAFKAINERMAADARRRPGNIFLFVAQDIGNPAVFHLTEGWTDQASIEEHIAGTDFQTVLAEAQKLRVEDRVATVYSAVREYELGMPA
jgi:quinol monooxygenase YgiN